MLFYRKRQIYNEERVERIELSSLAWKAKVLPLNYTRNCYNESLVDTWLSCIEKVVNFLFEFRHSSDYPFAKLAFTGTIYSINKGGNSFLSRYKARRYGQVVRQWIANPLSPVRIWVSP